MKIKLKQLWVVLLVLTVFVFASCDKKTPDKGYLSDEEVLEIVEGFSSTTDYSTYSVKGNLNFKGIDEELIPPTVDIENEIFSDSMNSSSGIGVNLFSNITSKALYFKLYIEDKELHNAGLLKPKFDAEQPYRLGIYEEALDKYSYMKLIIEEDGSYNVELTEDFEKASAVTVITEGTKYYLHFTYEEKKIYIDIQLIDGIPSFVITETPDGPYTSFNMKNAVFTKKIDDITYYFEISNPSESYYLRLPLHISYLSWTNAASGHKTLLEERLLTSGETLDILYYYTDADGNLIIKTFGANKALIIKNPTKITCHAKWNVTIVYDKNGYLVSEKFETINTHKAPKTETCYGEAKYTFA